MIMMFAVSQAIINTTANIIIIFLAVFVIGFQHMKGLLVLWKPALEVEM